MISLRRRVVQTTLVFSLCVDCVIGQVVFHDVGALRGIGRFQNEAGVGSGIAAADYDGDGFVDVFVPQASGVPNQLYRSLGNGTFEEVAAAVGLDSTDSSRTALWVDHDGDADLDLFVANDDVLSPTAFRLYRQDATGFTDVTVSAGVFKKAPVFEEAHHWGGICAGDINNDGYLDICTVQWSGPGHLFLNDRDGTFSDISESSGLARPAAMHQPMMADFNSDGWLDIYVTVDFQNNRLWINQHDNTFVDVAVGVGAANAMNDMGLALGDYDNDGDFDIYVTNIYIEVLSKHNILLRNESTPDALKFRDVSAWLEVDNGYFGWGTTFVDVDNDGFLDIATTNGWESVTAQHSPDDPSRLFLNPGRSGESALTPFVDISTAAHFDDMDYGSSLVAFDFDRDGDLDLMQVVMGGPLRLLENRPAPDKGGTKYLVVKPRIRGPNHFAIGAVVRVSLGDMRLTRLITAGTSYMGQEPAEAFFGLGEATSAAEVVVEWPDGRQSRLSNVAANQVVTVVAEDPPTPFFVRGDSNADGRIDISDGIRIFNSLILPENVLSCLDASDVDDNGVVELTDGVRVLGFLFLGREPPSASRDAGCGPDRTEDRLDCRRFERCR